MTIEIKELNIKSEIGSKDKSDVQEALTEIENRILRRVMQELSEIKRSRITNNNER